MTIRYCEHNIRVESACPWCKRKGNHVEHIRNVKKFWQFYQLTFDSFLQQVRKESEGSLAVSIVAHDGNGKVYTLVEGPIDMLEAHVPALEERIKDERRKLQC